LQKILFALAKLLQRIFRIVSSPDDLGNARLANIVEDRLDLFDGGRFLSDVKLERIAGYGCLRCVVTGLVNSSPGLGIGGNLLDQVGNPGGSWRAGLVEDGDNV
jgi:hypothetical protein